jgi:tetratricopeptide (TPR) repeat protein
MGDYEMAERRARKCLEILQENVKCLYRLGLCCNEQKKYEEAKKYLKYALCIKPDSLTIRDEYNKACKHLKDEMMAVKKTWKGAFQRTNKLGDKEEVAKLKENAELNDK